MSAVQHVTPFTAPFPSGKILKIVTPSTYASGGRSYNFTKWEDNSTNPTRTITVTGNVTLTATYTIVPQYVLTVLAGVGGTTSPSAGQYPYDQGTVVPVTASPSADFNFAGWIVDGAATGNTNPTYNITMNAAHSIQPSFVAKKINLTVVAGANGTVNPTGTFALDIGSTYSFTETPNTTPYPGYHFDHWDLNGANLGSTPTLNLTATAAMNGQTLTALFTVNPHNHATITVAVSGTGTTNPSAGAHQFNIDDPTPVVFTATEVAGSGFRFDHWNFMGTDYSNATVSLLVTAPMDGQTITAVFVPIVYNVTINSAPQGVTLTVTEMN